MGVPTGAARRRFRWPRLGWWRWMLIAAALLIVGAAAGYRVAVAVAPPLQSAGASSWWYPQDSARAVDTEADGARQTTVPIRSGRQQGYVFTVDNPSDWTQIVLGALPGPSPGAEYAQVSVATADPYHGGGVFLPLHYGLPESIPPHQTRAVRIMWISTMCLPAESSRGIGAVTLRVSLGGFTRTENIQLPEQINVSGPSQGPCAG